MMTTATVPPAQTQQHVPQPYQQHVVDEKRELDDKLAKLTAFLSDGDKTAGLAHTDLKLLRTQKQVMRNYSRILQTRINRF